MRSYTGFYAGPPLRVIEEPETAYRRVPPEIKIPWFEDMSPLPQDPGMRQIIPDD
jgi:hypothetical protein